MDWSPFRLQRCGPQIVPYSKCMNTQWCKTGYRTGSEWIITGSLNEQSLFPQKHQVLFVFIWFRCISLLGFAVHIPSSVSQSPFSTWLKYRLGQIIKTSNWQESKVIFLLSIACIEISLREENKNKYLITVMTRLNAAGISLHRIERKSKCMCFWGGTFMGFKKIQLVIKASMAPKCPVMGADFFFLGTFFYFWLQFPSILFHMMERGNKWKQEGLSAGFGVQSWFSS